MHRVAGLLVVLALAGCTARAAASSGSARSAPTRAQIVHDIEAADFDKPQTLRAVEADAQYTDAAAAAKTVLAGTHSDAPTWGAVLLYADTGSDPAPLRPLVADPHPDIRAMAAGGLVGNGDASGFPVLINTLGLSGLIRGSTPPMPLWQFAALILVRVTANAALGPALDSPTLHVVAAQHRWQQWWHANRSRLRWNAAKQLWTTA